VDAGEEDRLSRIPCFLVFSKQLRFEIVARARAEEMAEISAALSKNAGDR